jgi:hypothetical protein
MKLIQPPTEVTQNDGLYENWGRLASADRRTGYSVQVRIRDDLETSPEHKMLGPLWNGGWLNTHEVGGLVDLIGESPSGVAASPIITLNRLGTTHIHARHI